MDNLGTNSTAPLDPRLITESFAGSIPKLSQPPPPSPAFPEESRAHFAGWEPISKQRDSYDGRDCLDPSYNLTSEKLGNRGEDEVVIFDYSLNSDRQGRVDGDSPIKGEGPSSEPFSADDDDIFFRVSKKELVMSEQFDRIVNPTKPRLTQSWGPRLGVIDFPQCYDTHDHHLLNSMGEKLGLLRKGETAFMDTYLRKVRTLPGRGRFRTGISLRTPFNEPSELPKSGLTESPESGSSKPPKAGSSEDRFILFVSFPYFGESSEKSELGLERESVKLLEFKRLGGGVRGNQGASGREGSDDIGEILVEKREILVHQARYMIFDNHIMATFRSKEDNAKDQVPLHRFQERDGAFSAMAHMIANRMDSELWAMGELQNSLCKLEEDIDQMISDAELYEDDQGMKRSSDDEPLQLKLPPGVNLTETEVYEWEVHYNRRRQNKIQKRKQRRVRHLLTTLNRLLAALFAAIGVAERQMAVLHDLRKLFLTSYQTKAKDHEKEWSLRRNPFSKNTATIPILSGNPEQIRPNSLDTIDEVVRKRKCFVRKVERLVENMDSRRKILSAFLKSDQAKAAPSERTVQDTTDAIKRTEVTLTKIEAQLAQQGQAVYGFTIITIAFLPLNFSASYFGMQTMKEFSDSTAKMSISQFWLITGPSVAAILLLTAIIALWSRPFGTSFRPDAREESGPSPKKWFGRAMEQIPTVAKHKHYIKKRLPWSLGKKISDPETPSLQERTSTWPIFNSQEEILADPPPPHPGEESEESCI